MTEDEIDDEVCRIMVEDGPNGHINGHELLTALVLKCMATEREACKAKVLAAAEGYAPMIGKAYSKEFEAAHGALRGVAAAL